MEETSHTSGSPRCFYSSSSFLRSVLSRQIKEPSYVSARQELLDLDFKVSEDPARCRRHKSPNGELARSANRGRTNPRGRQRAAVGSSPAGVSVMSEGGCRPPGAAVNKK